MNGNNPDSPKSHIPPEDSTQATTEHLRPGLGTEILMKNYIALALIIWPHMLTHSKTPHAVDNDEKQEGTKMHQKSNRGTSKQPGSAQGLLNSSLKSQLQGGAPINLPCQGKNIKTLNLLKCLI